jgi:hypothetical protein
MKRMVLIAMGLMLLAGSAFAQPFPGLPDTAYVGLFKDVAHTIRSMNYTAIPPAFQSFTMYIFWLPSNMGLQAAEFGISYPLNVLDAVTTKNPLVVLEMGTLKAGISISFAEITGCQTDWVYSHVVTCFLKDATQSEIMVIPHPTVGAYQVASCELGYPIYPVKRFTHLYLNWDGGTAVEPKSWGSIKSLFR